MASSQQYTPPGTPPSPSASVYDLSDDEEGDYNTIRHKRSGKGVKLLFSKSKVYVHPTPSAKENIPGFIALIEHKPPVGDVQSSSPSSTRSARPDSLHLAWVPESALGDAYDTYVKVDLCEASSPPKQSYLVPPLPTTRFSASIGTYAFAVSITEIYSLQVRPPSIGWWYGSIIINTRSGDSYPALFFHDSECQSTILQRKKLVKESFDPFGDGGGMFWGGDEILRWLKRYVTVERSAPDPNSYLIDPSEADRLGFDLQSSNKKQTLATSSPKGKEKQRRDGGMDPLTKTLKETRWNFLEKLSQVTTFTRRAAQAVADNPKVPPQVRRLMKNPEVVTLQEEFDSARLYLARWAMGIAEQSEKEKRQRMWTARDVLEMEETAVGDFEILEMEAGNLSIADQRRPVTLTEWQSWFDPHTGRLQITPDEVKDRVFHGGLDAEDGVRKEAWLFLLGVYDWSSSTDERHAVMNTKRDEYIRLKGAWWDRMAEGNGTTEEEEWWKEQRMRIGEIEYLCTTVLRFNSDFVPFLGIRHVEKDVHRTDRNIPLFAGEDIPHPDQDSPFAEVGTNVHLEQMKDMLLTYNEYNKDLGYVQGMSDLLAPIYAVMQDDAVAFWGFVGFMQRMERNFLRDQSGMRLQLLTLDHLVQLVDPKLYLHLQKAESTNFFFFFRMLLVWFKRELQWPDVLRLWESLWTDFYSSSFHLFFALAILEKHRNVIMEHLQHFDEVLKYINELSNTIDMQSTMIRAEALFIKFQRVVETIDKKHNFPAPTVRPRKSRQDSESADKTSAVTTGTDRGPQKTVNTTTPAGRDDAEEQVQVISLELRDLLSRKVSKLDKQEIVEHGGGIN